MQLFPFKLVVFVLVVYKPSAKIAKIWTMIKFPTIQYMKDSYVSCDMSCNMSSTFRVVHAWMLNLILMAMFMQAADYLLKASVDLVWEEVVHVHPCNFLALLRHTTCRSNKYIFIFLVSKHWLAYVQPHAIICTGLVTRLSDLHEIGSNLSHSSNIFVHICTYSFTDDPKIILVQSALGKGGDVHVHVVD